MSLVLSTHTMRNVSAPLFETGDTVSLARMRTSPQWEILPSERTGEIILRETRTGQISKKPHAIFRSLILGGVLSINGK